MSFLERRFLLQFREDGDGYVIVRRGREVRFSPTEVAGLLEEWRRLWRAPWLWTGWLILGVIAPAWVAWNGYTAAAVILGLLTNLFVIVVLIPSWQKPGEVAESRLPFEPDAPRPAMPPSWWQLGLFGTLTLMYGYELVRGHDLSKFTFFGIWAGIFAANVWQMVRYRQGKWQMGQRDPVALLIMAAAAIAIAAVTALNPNRQTFDVAIAGLYLGVLAVVGAILLWKHFSPSPHAA